MIIKKTITIDAAPEEIWPYLIEPEKIMGWCCAFQRFEYIGTQQIGLGTPFYVEEKMAGPLRKLNFRITEWEEFERLGFEMISGSGARDYKQSWEIVPTPDGSEFTLYEEVKMPFGVVGKMLESFNQRAVNTNAEQMLEALKKSVESAQERVWR